VTSPASVHNASIKALIRRDGTMVAVLASIASGPARFFVTQPRESQDQLVGRVSRWVKEAGGTGLTMLEPDVLPEGIETGEVLMRIKKAIGVPRDAPDAPEHEVASVELVASAIGQQEN